MKSKHFLDRLYSGTFPCIPLVMAVAVTGRHLCSFGPDDDCSLWTYSAAFIVSGLNTSYPLPVREGVLVLQGANSTHLNMSVVVESVWFNKSSASCSFLFDLIILEPATLEAAEVQLQSSDAPDHILWSSQDEPSETPPRWHRHKVLLGSFTNPFRILLEVSVKLPSAIETPLLGIDNLHLEQCFAGSMKDNTCPLGSFPCRADATCLASESLCDFTADCSDSSDEADICDALPEGTQCDFEHDLCGWIPSSGDGWIRLLAADVSGSPPFNDHTTKAWNGSLLAINFGGLKDTSASYRIRSRIYQRFTSPEGSECAIRFYYRTSGLIRFAGVVLVIHHAEESAAEGRTLWKLTPHNEDKAADPWRRASVKVPETYHRFFVQFVEVGGIRKGAFAIDDFSLSWGCFFQGGWQFLRQMYMSVHEPANRNLVMTGINGSSRPITPAPAVPDIRFNLSDCLKDQCAGVSRVKNERMLPDGVYRWLVPVSGVYQIIAQGASGGGPSERKRGSACRGSGITSLVQLAGQTEVVLVAGEPGQAACPAVTETEKISDGDDQTCEKGGGGGGGSFVYKEVGRPGRSGRYEAIVAAHGGNGYSLVQPQCADTPRNTETCADTSRQRAGGFGGGGKSCGTEGGSGGWYFPLERTSEPYSEASPSTEKPAGQDANGWVFVQLMCKCRVDCLLDQANLTLFCPVQSQGEERLDNAEDKTLPYILSGGLFVLALGGILFCLSMACRKDAAKRVSRRRGIRSCMSKCSEAEYGNIPLHNLRDGTCSIPLMETNQLYELSGVRTFEHVRRLPGNSLLITQPIGRGAFGTVYRGTMQTGKARVDVAMKALNNAVSAEADVDFATEALIVSRFHHPNIVACFGVSADFEPSCIVLELLPGGDVKSFLQRCRSITDSLSTSMNELLDITIDIARGCQYMEEHRFVHRDIAARNCLLTSTGKGRSAKIADFGMARDVFRSEYYRRNASHLLPVKWMAPESLTEGLFSSKSDLWSFGVFLWEVFSLGCSPYPGLSNQEVMAYVCNGGTLSLPSPYCPDELYELMQDCWVKASTDRVTFSVVLEKLLELVDLPAVTSARLPATADAPLPLLSVTDLPIVT